MKLYFVFLVCGYSLIILFFFFSPKLKKLQRCTCRKSWVMGGWNAPHFLTSSPAFHEHVFIQTQGCPRTMLLSLTESTSSPPSSVKPKKVYFLISLKKIDYRRNASQMFKVWREVFSGLWTTDLPRFLLTWIILCCKSTLSRYPEWRTVLPVFPVTFHR